MKVDRCRRNLKWWSKVAFGNVTRDLKKKKELLRMAEADAIRGGGVLCSGCEVEKRDFQTFSEGGIDVEAKI